MNQISPNTLKDHIRIMNSDLSEVNIVEVDGRFYTTESGIKSFMESNDISSSDELIESLNTFYDIESITLLNESTAVNEDLKFAMNTLSLLESLNPHEVIQTAKGKTLFKTFISQFSSFIRGQEYDEASDVESYIRKCDKILGDIQEEKKLARKKHGDSSAAKFSAMYIFNIARNLFMIFFVPSILSSDKIKWPAAVGKLFLNNGKKAVAGEVVKHSVKFKRVASLGLTGLDVATTLPPDIKGLYLSFADYDGLLNEYENQIKQTRNNLRHQLSKLERSKGMNASMMKITEDSNFTDAVNVHYQTPEELMAKDHTPEIVHDDTDQQVDMEFPVDKEVPPAIEEPSQPVQDVPSPAIAEKPADPTPIDIIHQAKCDPRNIPIANYNGKYYIDHKDLKCYMDACGTKKYESALATIIQSHDDPNFCKESVRIVMGENDMSNLDSETKLAMESSSVQFEVYSTRKA